MRLLPEVVRRLLAITDADELLREACTLAQDFLGADEVSLFLVDPAGKELVEHEVVGRKLRPTRYRLRVRVEGIVGWVASNRKAIAVSDVRKDSRYVQAEERVRSEAAVPILIGEKMVGVLNFESNQLGYFQKNDLSVLEFLGSQIALALRMAELAESAQRWEVRMSALNNLSRLGGGVVPAERMLQRVVDTVRATCGIHYASVFLGDYDREEVVLLAQSSSNPLNIAQGARMKFGMGLIGKAFALGETVNVRDVRHDPMYVAKVPGVVSEICVPIRIGDHSIGILDAQAQAAAAFSTDDVMFLETVARLLAPSLQTPAAEIR